MIAAGFIQAWINPQRFDTQTGARHSFEKLLLKLFFKVADFVRPVFPELKLPLGARIWFVRDFPQQGY
jgi:hypothetical protein